MKLKSLSMFVSIVSCLCSYPSSAQVIPDTTLHTSVTHQGDTEIINGGTVSGNNLFHSFNQFSVLTGHQVYFNNSSNIQNIFSRITGYSISSINGIIRDNGTANLYILNPNGILFGPNAQLNIGGSFLATTADSIKFLDQSLFGITQSTSTPILSGTTLESLIIGENPGSIIILGNGSKLSLDSSTDLILGAGFSTSGLIVRPGKFIALIGGNIELIGGEITARGGKIIIGSFADGEVKISPDNQSWVLDDTSINALLDISLSNKALIDVSGGGGSIQLTGNNIFLTGGSAILNQNQGLRNNGVIAIDANSNLFISGASDDGAFPTFIGTQTIFQGNAGDLNINATNIAIQDGARLSSLSYSKGDSGAINVNALDSFLISGKSSSIVSGSFSLGNSGNITINSPIISIQNSGFLVSIALGQGNASSISLNTDRLNIFQGLLGSVSLASGNAGNIYISATNLSVQDSIILTSTFDSGDAGNIIIDSPIIYLDNSFVQSNALPISSVPFFNSLINHPLTVTGKPGEIQINTDQLTAINNTNIFSGVFGSNGGGVIRINANSINLDGNSQISTSSFSSAQGGNIFIDAYNVSISNNSHISSNSFDSGTAGNIRIQTHDLDLTNNSGIVTSSLLSGNAGSISIFADTIKLSDSNISAFVTSDFNEIGENIILDPQLFTNSNLSPINGNSGNINIDTKLLFFTNSSISTSSQGSGKGGSININAQAIAADSSSLITANSQNSFGGNINIAAGGVVFANGFKITASSDLGSQFNGTVNLSLNSTSPSIAVPADINLLDTKPLLKCTDNGSGLTYSGSGDTPTALAEHIALADFYKPDPIQTSLFITDRDTGEKIPLIEPVGWKKNKDGTISFVANKTDAIQYVNKFSHCLSVEPTSDSNHAQAQTLSP